MRYLRLLSPVHWNAHKNRFVSLAFRNSSAILGGGISVIDRDCAEERSGTCCRHIARYYLKFSVPVIFWDIDSEELPAHTVRQEMTESGDLCHYNILGLADRDAEAWMKEMQREARFHRLQICWGEGEPALADQTSFERWLAGHEGT